jgi:sigma-B regulation protein RsbU (phosphoserine phosphatase)
MVNGLAVPDRGVGPRSSATDDSTAMDQQPQQMACMEVWGGSQLTDRTVEFSGLDAWVYSRPYAEAANGGDVVYVSSCATGRITRLLLADVAGHGAEVASTAADLRLLMRRFVNTLDQAQLVRRLNKRFAALQRDAMFATAIVTTFFAPTRRLVISNAGHPRPFVYRASRREWQILRDDELDREKGPRNLPLGILSLSEYDQLDVQLAEGDCLLAYTDAITEAQDANGDVLGEEGLQRILSLLGEVQPETFVQTLVDEIGRRYPGNLATDDVTVLLARANAREIRYSLWDRLRAFGRFSVSVLKSLNPASERPPVPDLHVANVGGAIVPALGQRWRKEG